MVVCLEAPSFRSSRRSGIHDQIFCSRDGSRIRHESEQCERSLKPANPNAVSSKYKMMLSRRGKLLLCALVFNGLVWAFIGWVIWRLS